MTAEPIIMQGLHSVASPTDRLQAALQAPFGVDEVDFRKQGKVSSNGNQAWVAYVDARAVAARLDEVFGFDGWQVSYAPGPQSSQTADICCTLVVRVDGEWISKSDGAPPSDIEPVKGGYSDAFRRAGAAYGVGRYLYSVPRLYLPESGTNPKPGTLYGMLPAWARVATAAGAPQPTQAPRSVPEPRNAAAPPATGRESQPAKPQRQSANPPPWLSYLEGKIMREYEATPERVCHDLGMTDWQGGVESWMRDAGEPLNAQGANAFAAFYERTVRALSLK